MISCEEIYSDDILTDQAIASQYIWKKCSKSLSCEFLDFRFFVEL